MKNRNRDPLYLIAIVGAALLYLGIRSFAPCGNCANDESHPKGGYFVVTRVIDGDTLKLSNGENVRLIGIDTPELHESVKLYRDAAKKGVDVKTIQALGRRSASFTTNLCKDKRVRLEFDVERKDRHKRLLAYVYLDDGTFVNAEILREGYAQAYTIPPNVKHSDYFLRLQNEARSSRRGLWRDKDAFREDGQ